MSHIVAAAQAAFLMSVIKPLLFAVVIILWGWLAAKMTEDAGYFGLGQRTFSEVFLASIFIGIILILYIPISIIGFFLGIVVIFAPFVGYYYYHNANVSQDDQWDISVARITGKVEDYKRQRAQDNAKLVILDSKGKEHQVPLDDEMLVAAHTLFAQILDFALPRGSERIDIAVDANNAQIDNLIDGVNYVYSRPDRNVAIRMINYISEYAGMKEDIRKKQMGVISIQSETFGKHKLDVQSAGSTRGVKMTIILDREELAKIKMDELGLLKSQKDSLKKLLAEKGGVVLIASPPKQGRTSTSYSLLQSHDPYTQSIQTLENDKPFEAEGVDHKEFTSSETEDELNRRLAASLRSSPGVMLVSQVVDKKMANLIASYSEDVRFYLPLVADDMFAALNQWIEMVGDRSVAANSLRAILAQRLVRKLCPTCKRPYKPNASALKKLNMPSDVDTLYQSSGKVMVNDKEQMCPTCQGLGYRGRMAIYELLPMDSQATIDIADNEMGKLRNYLRRKKVLWVQEAGLAQVVSGETDIKEITRVMSGQSGASKKSKKSQAKVRQSTTKKRS